jgi:hypothetical protein
VPSDIAAEDYNRPQSEEVEIPLVPPGSLGPDAQPTVRVRLGQTVRRKAYSWSPAVLDLLGHLERKGFGGAPRALGFDDQGREVLTYVEGEAGVGEHFVPDLGGRFDIRLPSFVWRDEVLIRFGRLIREFHDAAATFPWAGREWCSETQQPSETVCHNDLGPGNTVFRDGLPVAFIDWEWAAPGPRSWDLGLVAWRLAPFWRDEKCRAHGLPTGTADKARRFRLLLDAYGVEAHVEIVHVTIVRMRDFWERARKRAAAGSAWDLELSRRGVLDEGALEIAWMEDHAAALVEA